MISQDYRYLYITVAEWGREYEEYLYGRARPRTPPSQTASPSQDRGRPEARPVQANPGTSAQEPSGALRGGSPPQRQPQARGQSRAAVTQAQQSRAPPKKTAKRPKKAEVQDGQGSNTATQIGNPPAQISNAASQAGNPIAARYAGRTEAAGTGPPPATGEPSLTPDSFLVMKCYGPYSVDDAGHMAMFVRNVLALMLELSDPMDY